MLDSINPLVKVFRSVKDHPSLSSRDSLRLKLIKKITTDARIYNLPTADEIAALIVGDFDPENVERDIIVEERFGTLQRIDELHHLYLQMQYPLMFPRGEDGYWQDVLFRLHQKELRADSYDTLTQALSRGETTSSNIGKRIVLSSSFTGSERYSRENFQDAMTISQDRPDLLSRVFKIKLNALMKDITKEFLFGTCRADIYTIEFQKRGLPHAHILIWLNAEHKLTNEPLIDFIIYAEIPDQESNPRLYEPVKTFMIHGPCGLDRKNSPCMVKSICSKHFPNKFTDSTSFDEDGYCKYRRPDSGHFIEKNGIKLDNRFVVPYNPTLLRRYQAHINVEFCNQSRSIKYLFKYVSKEPSVERLTFHLPDQQGAVFLDNAPIDSVVFNATVKQTKFLAWFEANKKYPKARFLTYSQPSLFTKLIVASGLNANQDIKTIDGVVYPIFKDACYVMRLLDDDKEYIEGIIEGSKWSSDLHLDDDRVQEIALAETENILKINDRSLSDFPPMPMPNEALIRNIGNLLISEELNYDRNALKSEHAHLLSSLTSEQRHIYGTHLHQLSDLRAKLCLQLPQVVLLRNSFLEEALLIQDLPSL
ncbi:uncharacterized protein G2W53_017874 [Senna tora]|uniref:Helitron helicase-like domain-containing protein n=1 Tax=Senna tora TaxID=362788 RepID=A0A834TR13_9FABA|nr:uncharacterized protein G2W53_017874 [Senna tora]